MDPDATEGRARLGAREIGAASGLYSIVSMKPEHGT